LDSEQWVVVEVPGSFQDIVNRLIRRSGEGAAAMGGEVVPAAPPQAASAQSTAQSTPGQPSQQSVTLEVNGKRFHLVNSALMLLKLLDEYLALYDIVPSFGAEIVHRMLELLKQFNAQTCQLVLGAGAMQTAKCLACHPGKPHAWQLQQQQPQQQQEQLHRLLPPPANPSSSRRRTRAQAW